MKKGGISMQHTTIEAQNELEPTGKELYYLADFFKVLGAPTRIRTLQACR